MPKKKHSALGRRLIASAKEMVAHAKGELKLEVEEVRVPRAVKGTKSLTDTLRCRNLE